ncbi:MAG: pyruvate kinase [Deltaproteobacteria bacterium]|nr:pyruvate kinase [Deltaproteobacteria bacterium]
MDDLMLYRRTKMVCTVGPAVQTPALMENLVRAGMNVARFNFSHGDHDYHQHMIQLVRQASAEVGMPVALLADTQGPEIRTGDVANGEPIRLEAGKHITLTTEHVPGTERLLSISYKKLPSEVKKGTRILIADGLVELEVLRSDVTRIECLIHSNGIIGARKNVNVIGVKTGLPAVSEKDIADLGFAMRENMDFVAASFVRRAADIHEIQKVLERHRRPDRTMPLIIAKIEDGEGLANIDEIIRVSSGIMVARGDLGVQLPPEEIPLIQKTVIHKCNDAGKVVIVATQMLDSMIRNPLPTRAEVADVANAILDGADAVMLSGETAQGRYPVETAAMMHRIAIEAENSPYRPVCGAHQFHTGNMCDGIAQSAVLTAANIQASAIVAPTYGGNTPRLLSRFRPECPIVAVTPFDAVQRRLMLCRGVYPLICPIVSDSDTMLRQAASEARDGGFLKPFDKFVVAAGIPIGSPIMLNSVRVEMLADVVAHGQRGFGGRTQGTVIRAGTAAEAKKLLGADKRAYILVIEYLDESFVPFMPRISGYVAAHFSSMSFEMLSRENPSLVGIAGALGVYEAVSNGDDIILDGQEKLVLRAASVISK